MTDFQIADRIFRVGMEAVPDAAWQLGATRGNGEDLRLVAVEALPILEEATPVLRSPAGWEAWEGRVAGRRRIEYRLGGERVQVEVDEGQAFLLQGPVSARNSFWPLEPPRGELVTMALLEGQVLELHAAGVVAPDGTGWALAGPSGTGKSTISAIWAQQPPWRRLTEERLLLWNEGRHWRGEAAPWPLAVHREPGRMLLRGVLFLSHGPCCRLERVPPAHALCSILRCTFFLSGSRTSTEKAAGLARKLLDSVEVYSLEVAPTASSVGEVRERLGLSPGAP